MIGGGRVGASVTGIETIGVLFCPGAQAALSRMIKRKNRIRCTLLLCTGRLNFCRDFVGEVSFTGGSEMNGTVRKLFRRNEIPKIKVMPLICLSTLTEHLAIFIVCPARVEEIIADVAVRAMTDQNRFINQERG